MKLNKLRKAAMTIEFVIVVSILVLVGCLGTSYVFANYETLTTKANKVEDSIIVKGDGTVVGSGSQNGGTETPDGGEAVQLAAGFYSENGMFVPWDELVSRGYIGIDDNALSYISETPANSIENLGKGTLVFADNITKISPNAFNVTRMFTQIILPEGMTEIGEDALAWCVNLESIVIPSTVTNIKDWAFDSCSNLTVIYNNSFLIFEIGSQNYGSIAKNVSNIYNKGEWSYVNGIPTPNEG